MSNICNPFVPRAPQRFGGCHPRSLEDAGRVIEICQHSTWIIIKLYKKQLSANTMLHSLKKRLYVFHAKGKTVSHGLDIKLGRAGSSGTTSPATLVELDSPGGSDVHRNTGTTTAVALHRRHYNTTGTTTAVALHWRHYNSNGTTLGHHLHCSRIP